MKSALSNELYIWLNISSAKIKPIANRAEPDGKMKKQMVIYSFYKQQVFPTAHAQFICDLPDNTFIQHRPILYGVVSWQRNRDLHTVLL